MNEIQKQQQEIALRSFIKNSHKVIQALESGITLDDLVSNCESVCCHSCTNGYESEICNVKEWLKLLKQAEEKKIIPGGNLIDFLKLI